MEYNLVYRHILFLLLYVNNMYTFLGRKKSNFLSNILILFVKMIVINLRCFSSRFVFKCTAPISPGKLK